MAGRKETGYYKDYYARNREKLRRAAVQRYKRAHPPGPRKRRGPKPKPMLAPQTAHPMPTTSRLETPPRLTWLQRKLSNCL